MIQKLLFKFYTVLIFSSLLVQAQTAYMHGHIVDRSKNDCDFESFTGSGVYPGLFEDYLDANDKPIYKPSGATPVTCGPSSFSNWFYETRESRARCYDLPFEKVDNCSEVFSWESLNPTFFPIDGELGGNEGFNHNFHFTLHLEADFTFEPGQVIDVASDDDLWIYINGQLALDMGGVHSTIAGSLQLDLIADDLGLTAGNVYEIDIFYAERRADGAVLNIQHNLGITTF